VERNGFRALGEYDRSENGGNGDGWITPEDAIYWKVALWFDRNHDGRSDVTELASLSDQGVAAIALHYQPSTYLDEFGNAFRYRGKAKIDDTRLDNRRRGPRRFVYDVFFRFL
jgi:hypothetical protein